MQRRDFLKAGLGAVVAGSLAMESRAGADPPATDGLLLSGNGPIYQAASQPALNLTDAVTLEAWVKADAMPSGGGRILDKLVPGTNASYTLDTCPGNSLRLIAGSGSCSYDAHLSADHWTHVVGVYSASQKIMALFVDGKEAARPGWRFRAAGGDGCAAPGGCGPERGQPLSRPHSARCHLWSGADGA